ncbi:MAG: Spi family protease inhibitor [Bacteroidales bacterium]|nr:Spi family protease inhibitor [Bacteroidales bacterium]
MKHFSFLAVLSLAATILFACNEIDNVGFDIGSAVEQQMAGKTHSINVSQSEASGIADMFMRSEAGTLGVATKSADTKRISSSATVREDGQDLMYIFNYEDGGFVIVGSTRNYYPILAYSDKGSFELQDDMGPVDVWLDETKVGIKNSSLLDDATKAQMQNLWARYDGTYDDLAQQLIAARRPQTRSAGEDACWNRIDSLQQEHGSEGWTYLPLSFVEDLFTDLGLESYYDAICYSAEQNHSALNETIIGYKNPVSNEVGPLIGTAWFQWGAFGKLCPNHLAGCGAVAAGQVMFFHQYPTSMSWADTTFTWSDIPVSNDNLSKQPHLMRMLGQKFQMEYRKINSATTVTKVVNGLDSLGYEVSQANHNLWSVKNELLTGRRPVIMFGSNVNSPLAAGHFWVCEGSREIIYDAIMFYTENQPYGSGNFTQGMHTLNSPGTVGGSLFYHYFYMNWGAGYHADPNLKYNGWFAMDDVEYEENNPQYLRKDIYLYVQ